MKVVVLSSARRTTPEGLSLAAPAARHRRRSRGADHRRPAHEARAAPAGDPALVARPLAAIRRRAEVVPAGPGFLRDAVQPGIVDDADDDVDGPPPPAPLTARAVPGRLAHGVGWRVRRARAAVGRHPVARRVSGSAKVRAVRRLAPDRTSATFTATTLLAREVNDAVATADLVVALDRNTHQAAWFLARRHPGPDVVVGEPRRERSASGPERGR